MDAIDQNHRLAFLAAAAHHEPAFANAWYVLSPFGEVQQLVRMFRAHCEATIVERINQQQFVLSTLRGLRSRREGSALRMLDADIQHQEARLARLKQEAAEIFC